MSEAVTLPETKRNLTKKQREDLITQTRIRAAERLLRLKKGREDLIDFTRLTMPHPDDPDDMDMSLYEAAPHHRAIAAALEEVEKGHYPRLILVTPPRHGKSELASRRFVPWVLGRDPSRHVIFATYSDTFAEDFGREVRDIMKSPSYKQIFPNCKIRAGQSSSKRLAMAGNGRAYFVGRGGGTTGRGAHFLVIDDPVKDHEEADSPTVRESTWQWFTKTAATRLMTLGSCIVIIMTRWNEDDIVGRLTDPTNPHYNVDEAANWKIIHLPALAEDDDPLGREVGEALWPERFDVQFLLAQKRLNERGFSALYQGRPTPEDGDFFKREWVVDYIGHDLPVEVTYYGASDHAIGEDPSNHDETVLMIVGVDGRGNIWIVDAWHGRKPTDFVVDKMIDLMEQYKPDVWWAEAGHISKSIGPFLRKRQIERGVYVPVDEVSIGRKNKRMRAQSIQGRMAMRMLRFPRSKLFYSALIDQFMKFDGGKHDDFVDTLSIVGMKLDAQYGPTAYVEKNIQRPKTGTLAWVKWSVKEESKKAEASEYGGF